MKEPLRLDVDAALALIPAGARVLVQGLVGEPVALARRFGASDGPVRGTQACGLFIPGINANTWVSPGGTLTSFLRTPQMAGLGDALDFRPLNYRAIGRFLRAQQFDACLMQVAPPGPDGICSVGPAADFLIELWQDIPLRIAQINPALPAVSGYRGIPWSELTAVVERETDLPELAAAASDPVTQAIARHASQFIPDGATLQYGVGKLPGAVIGALKDRRNLGFHSGLVGDEVLALIDAGAVRAGPSVLAGAALGTRALYDRVQDPVFQFQPAIVTHDAATLARQPDMITINGALQVDLWGQVHSEAGPKGPISGPGGATDFAHGAGLGGGTRIIVLPSSSHGESRIVPAGHGRGPVTLGRFDTDIVVTEHGAADLRGLGEAARARALEAIAGW
jgi:acyl-CoA hydrolase